MSNAFFYDLLASVAERGRSMLKIKPWPKDADNRADRLVADCRALVAGRGEASGIALAAEILGATARSIQPTTPPSSARLRMISAPIASGCARPSPASVRTVTKHG